MNFASDNATGASVKVMQALLDANGGAEPAYGADAYSLEAAQKLSAIFERECAVFFVATGTASNALALAALTPPWGGIFCHEDAHIIDDECGAPEMFSDGAKLIGMPGRAGKITPDTLRQTLGAFPRGVVKQVQPAALSLSQANECGILYTCAEIAALTQIARDAGLGVHMDGARFANALVALGCTPAEMSWKAGVDVLSFGATKNGTFACEAVIFFDKPRAENFIYRRKRGGHTLSKGRLLGAQMLAYLDDGHWLDLARSANAHAARLQQGLTALPDVRMPWAAEANELFIILPRKADKALKAAGASYYDWGHRGLSTAEAPKADEIFIRLVTSFATRAEDVENFIAITANSRG